MSVGVGEKRVDGDEELLGVVAILALISVGPNPPAEHRYPHCTSVKPKNQASFPRSGSEVL
jgi:hypothetical protein